MSGPLHRLRNPFGEGDEIRGDIVFWPWYSDTNHTIDRVSVEEFMSVPVDADLAVYPNPFNTEAKIRFAVSQPGIYRVELFDVAGRVAERLWTGPVADEKEVALNGARLASGIYFVRLVQTRSLQSTATRKVVLLK